MKKKTEFWQDFTESVICLFPFLILFAYIKKLDNSKKK